MWLQSECNEALQYAYNNYYNKNYIPIGATPAHPMILCLSINNDKGGFMPASNKQR